MKRMLCRVISVLLILSLFLSGCSKNKGDKAADEGGQLTKEEWIGLLGDKFGYNLYENEEPFFSDVSVDNAHFDNIQACKEWGILIEEGALEPESKITWQYAVETSVRAIGIEKLNLSNIDIEVSENNLKEFFTTNIGEIAQETWNMGLSETDGILLLAHAYDYAMNLTLAERYERTYTEAVKEVKAEDVVLKGDGVTASVTNGENYQEGDILYVEPSQDNPAYAIKIDSVDGDKVTYQLAEMEDVFEELHVTGTFEAGNISIEPAEGVTISMSNQNQAASITNASYISTDAALNHTLDQNEDGVMLLTGLNMQGDTVNFDANLPGGGTVNVSVSSIKVTTDVDYGLFKGLKKADFTVSMNDQVVASYSKSEERSSGQIPLGSATIPLGPTPLTAELSLVVNLGFDGEATLTYSSTVVANANYRQGCGLASSVNNQNAACDFHAKATITAEPTVKAELGCLGGKIANVKVTSGVVAVATIDADLLGDEPTCIDILMWVPLRWAINEDGCIMTAISDKLRVSSVVWDANSSAVKQHFHWEDLVLVDACTRGTGEEVETEVVEEGDQPYEYTVFEFEEIVFGSIRVASQVIHLSEEETLRIGVLSVPGGYDIGSLRYVAEDPSVCSVSDGVVTAQKPGTTQLQISTPDGKFQVFLSVFVEEPYEDTSGFQSL